MIWIKPGSEGTILDLVLALECEWRMGQEIYDFQKLLLARADHRVMVFQGNLQHRTNTIAKMREGIKQFAKSSAGDRYLFACWDREPSRSSERNFYYELYVVPKS
jgi:hypothetical protein